MMCCCSIYLCVLEGVIMCYDLIDVLADVILCYMMIHVSYHYITPHYTTLLIKQFLI